MSKSTLWAVSGLTYSLNTTSNIPFQTGYAPSTIFAPFYDSGTVSKLYVRVRTNSMTTATQTLTFYNYTSSTNGNLTVSISAWQTGEFTDYSNSDTITSGNIYTIRNVVQSGGTGSSLHAGLCLVFEATTDTVYSGMVTNAVSYSANRYQKIAGILSSSVTTESTVQTEVSHTCTAQNLYVRVQSNASTATTTVWLRVNGSTSALQVSVGSTATGNFADTTHTVSLVAGDDICTIASWMNGSFAPSFISCHFSSTDGSSMIFYSWASSISTTTYSVIGANSTVNATENFAKFQLWADFVLTKMNVRVTTNTRNGTGTVKLRVNGADGNNNVSVPSTTTGLFSDTTNSDTVTESDEVNFAYSVAGSSGSITYATGSILLSQPAPTTSIKTFLWLVYASTKTVDSLALSSMKTFNWLQ